MPEVFCVDPAGRPPYRGKTTVRVKADVVWFDDGYQKAVKDEIVDLSVKDAAIYAGSAQVEFLEKPSA